jgi:hypothetical protein
VVYLAGEEPHVRFRELGERLPELCEGAVSVHVVTSAVRPLPPEWASLDRLSLDVSVGAEYCATVTFPPPARC